MRVLDAFISFICAIIVLVLAVSVILVFTGLTSTDVIYGVLNQYVFNPEYRCIVLTTSIVLVLAVLKVTIFSSRLKSKDNSPITVETEHGNVEIAQETITNTVKSVALKLDNVKDVNAKMIKKKKGIKIFTTLSVLANTNIKELTEKLQQEVIDVVKDTTGVKVLDVNVKVKNIYEKANKKNINTVKEQPKVAETAEAIEKETECIENTIEETEEVVTETVAEETDNEKKAK